MKNSRRIGAAVVLATAAVGMAAVTTTAPAVAAPRGPQPVSSWLRAVEAQSDNFLAINWRTDRRICHAIVRVAGRNIDVEYPGHRRYTSFTRGSSLRPGRTDASLLIVNPDVDRPGVARLRVAIAYDDCSRHARTRVNVFTLALPVLRNDRPGHGGPGWPGGNGNGNGNGNGHGGPGWPGGQGNGQGGPGGPNHQHPTWPASSPATTPASSAPVSTPPSEDPASASPSPSESPSASPSWSWTPGSHPRPHRSN